MPSRSYQLQVDVQCRENAATALGRQVQALAFLTSGFLLRRDSSSTSRLIGQPLAFHALQKVIGALYVIDAKRDAIVIAKVELGEIAVQVIMRAMLIHTFHATLENREETFDGVGMDAAVIDADILTGTVVDHGMASEVFA